MTRDERKRALAGKGVTLTSLAERLGVSLSHLSQVISDDRRSQRIEDAVAEAIGLSWADVFPPLPKPSTVESSTAVLD